MDLLPFNVRPSRRSVQLLSAGYGVLALLACYYLVSETLLNESLSPLWWLLGGALLVALSLEFRHRYRRLRAQHGILAWDEGLGISWQGQRWSYRSALFLGRAGVVIWVRREHIDASTDIDTAADNSADTSKEARHVGRSLCVLAASRFGYCQICCRTPSGDAYVVS